MIIRQVFVYNFPKKIMNSINETLESLLHACSFQIYKPNPQHLILSSPATSKPCLLKHNFRYFDKKCGNAMMIMRICRNCEFSDAEIIPPKQKRIVLTH